MADDPTAGPPNEPRWVRSGGTHELWMPGTSPGTKRWGGYISRHTRKLKYWANPAAGRVHGAEFNDLAQAKAWLIVVNRLEDK